ncbi:MAG: hypothetical protein ACAH95_13530 [Fimbriimonas sp.]
MHIEKREDPNPEMGYEIRDINSLAIWKSTMWFLAFALISAVLGGGVFYFMNPGLKNVNEHAIASKRTDLATTVPLLQSNTGAKTDIMLMRQKEEEALRGAPKRNRDGSFTIPIAAAMKMVVESGAKTPGEPRDVTWQNSQGPASGVRRQATQPDVTISEPPTAAPTGRAPTTGGTP